MTLKVIDLFCGGGGLSAGLQHAGFDVILGIDNDKWAVETFRANHPEADAIKMDLRDFNPEGLPDCDILVGGPPCVEFSTSKPEANRNVIAGLLLVQSFLRAVHHLKPKYWIMENIPRLSKYLPDEIPYRWFGVDEDGFLDVPQKNFFVAADFGAPQLRKRYLVGDYPTPEASHGNVKNVPQLTLKSSMKRWRTFGEALASLPNPYKAHRKGIVRDFNFGFELPEAELTDHFYDPSLSKQESRSIEKAKQAHPYMGFLPFPDALDRPARTIVATQLGRETIIVDDQKNGEKIKRRLTVRECATLQTFPITFQFFGTSYNKRYSLVGNAVPPILSYAIGEKIRFAEGMPVLNEPRIEKMVNVFPPQLGDVLSSGARKKTMRADRKFSELVPGKEMRGCRAELDNRGCGTDASGRNRKHPKSAVVWTAKFYAGEGRSVQSTEVTLQAALEEFITGCPHIVPTEMAINFLVQMRSAFKDLIVDAATLQSRWVEEARGNELGPAELVEKAATVINNTLPKERFERTRLLPQGHLTIAPRIGTRVRIVAGLIAAAYIASATNRENQSGSPSGIDANEETFNFYINHLSEQSRLEHPEVIFPDVCNPEIL